MWINYCVWAWLVNSKSPFRLRSARRGRDGDARSELVVRSRATSMWNCRQTPFQVDATSFSNLLLNYGCYVGCKKDFHQSRSSLKHRTSSLLVVHHCKVIRSFDLSGLLASCFVPAFYNGVRYHTPKVFSRFPINCACVSSPKDSGKIIFAF